MQFQGKVALVTGGGRGIGKIIALKFAREGADVVVTGEAEPPLRETAAEIEALGRESLAILCDFLKPDQADAMVDKAIEKFGQMDILVNNSGIEGPTKTVAEMDLVGWNETIAINLNGAMLCSRNVLDKSMIPRKCGIIINMYSAAGRKGRGLRSAYATTKFGIIGLTHALAIEAGKYGIRVNAIAPGAVEGERIENVFKKSAESFGIPYKDVIARSNSLAALGRMVKLE